MVIAAKKTQCDGHDNNHMIKPVMNFLSALEIDITGQKTGKRHEAFDW